MPVIIHELPKRADRVIAMGSKAQPAAAPLPASSEDQVIEPEPMTMAAVTPIPESDQKQCELCNAIFHADRIDPLCMECRAGMGLAKVTTPSEPESKRGRKRKVVKEQSQEEE